ncbi:AN1-type zinc finger protein 4-like [Amphibalanus amphitrite]|uniref:AN1-type zinc finger protein 4-like n=1 Tax=Amphibalanus amphitrite TaxID=1232801 RepID=UPI001C8FDB52|nr:AN1-type zinc finger protein 4-like [Amphibalanus amphitrite]XP_043213173.1 AN1-type zinc finger protein 4-like [Amphibalanus amphitrite]XP_043213174.1 AN1-type zinc finger protein 4-like [Amphibalanus amphitrite]XP_043213175.1 AN1-type zinc finger protein 4-like [Amphibalanus amphitrite]XP_043213176.1 AN1-type zinc finger protein 4-like [Amphibalanus amphitrite]XP_043213177.1 AN1-type zinc finger protein 4-like [Amphibalanus amphitrite]XP_043213178.1 AN1-type zinc finger protein 4-like [A
MAPASRRPAAIEVLVETLTGAGFRLRVSSFETVLSVKARIQRIEGVPVSQQHLIYNNKELLDGSSLLESGVHSGSRIQLVVAMRGGPVNMKRLPMYDDITRAELHQLMDMQSESPWESDSSGRQVTLLVLREGDQVNFYRVMENGDGTFSPLSDSWGAAIRNMYREEDPDELRRRIDENTNTMSKVTELKRKMHEMSVKKKGRPPPSRGRRTPRPTAPAGRVHLPPVTPAPTTAPTGARQSASFPPVHGELSESFSRLSRRGAAQRETREAEVPTTAARGVSAVAETDRVLTSRGGVTSRGQVTSGRRRKLSLSESTELFKQVSSAAES